MRLIEEKEREIEMLREQVYFEEIYFMHAYYIKFTILFCPN